MNHFGVLDENIDSHQVNIYYDFLYLPAECKIVLLCLDFQKTFLFFFFYFFIFVWCKLMLWWEWENMNNMLYMCLVYDAICLRSRTHMISGIEMFESLMSISIAVALLSFWTVLYSVLREIFHALNLAFCCLSSYLDLGSQLMLTMKVMSELELCSCWKALFSVHAATALFSFFHDCRSNFLCCWDCHHMLFSYADFTF